MAHLTLRMVFTVLGVAHIVLRRWRRAVTSGMLIASAAATAVAGFVQWGGLPAAIPWHGASSVALIALGAGHAARHLRRRRNKAGPTARAGVTH